MKKSILSPLCSAIIIPGLGQILNQNRKKGLTILAVVFILLIGSVVKLTTMILSLVETQDIVPSDSLVIMEKLRRDDFSVFWILLMVFGIVWLYSIVDAFLEGRKIDGRRRQDLK